MHFTFFVINLIGWTIVGMITGLISLQNHRRKENLTLFLAVLGGLLGGIISFATHGMWVENGIDFFNFLVALSFSVTAVYAFIPEKRMIFYEMFEKAKTFGRSNLSETKEATQRRYFAEDFWRSISSTLIPR